MAAQSTAHIYADANYGDDAIATAQNPTATQMFQQHPLAGVPGATPPSGFVQQAPYAFRTVTAALAYVTTLNVGTLGGPEFAIIHVAPGLYGPIPPGQPAIDPDSGLPWNGEALPLRIPRRVSIQGTSALDTIFDARGEETSVFALGAVGNAAYDLSFIDGVTIRGARGGFGPPGQRLGCGVVIENESPVSSSITNCFITDNQVGVAIVCDDGQFLQVHIPTIVCNTFAFNEVGVWSGALGAGPGPDIEGHNRPVIANNVFDTATPSFGARPGTMIGISAFEGLAAADVTITVGALAFDSNAYEASATPTRVDIADTLPPGGAPGYLWLPTVTRGRAGPPATPAVDITQFTNPPSGPGSRGLPSTDRGALYIADIFRIDPATQVAGTPRSRHDFRLAPEALLSSTATAGVQNPLINAGIDEVTIGGPLVAGNNTIGQVGLPAGLAEPVARLDGWDFDCDGAFNPRLSTKEFAGFSGQFGIVDIGADEMSGVLISGYLDNTRIFSTAHGAAGIPSRTRLFFFNFFRGSSAFYPRPQFNASIDFARTTPTSGVTSAWYDQLLNHPYQDPTFAIPVGNYTDGRFSPSVVNTRFNDVVGFSFGLKNSPPFMRNLVCDISPHLYHAIDPNLANPALWVPFWAESPLFVDIFQANPWWAQNNPGDENKDNPRLYFDATLTPQRVLRLGILSPPVTVIANDIAVRPNSFLFADVGASPRLHPDPAVLNWNGNPGFIYQVTPRGWGDTFAPETVPVVPVPGNDWQGARYNVELFSPADPFWASINAVNNLQTLLVVQGEAIPAQDPMLGIDTLAASQPAVAGVPLTPKGAERLAADRARARIDLEAFFKNGGQLK